MNTDTLVILLTLRIYTIILDDNVDEDCDCE